MNASERYMQRCIELAMLGSAYTAPNPMVGAVLVNNHGIIGEGYHQVYGEAHAEVNCLNSVPEEQKSLFSSSVLYVSLEPCAHFGKTPPCADFIIRNGIPKVVVGCRDPFKEVDGKGIEKLLAAGVEVETGILESSCRALNKRFFTFHLQKRPYVILKWAETGNHKIAGKGAERLLITNEFTNRLSHKWRSEEAAIMIGTNTALQDDPSLTNRLWSGSSPVRMVIDLHLRLADSLQIFDQRTRTVIFNTLKQEDQDNVLYYQVNGDASLVPQLMEALYQLNITSVIIEGGERLLQSFIDEGTWDEARVITNNLMIVEDGLPSPVLTAASWISREESGSDAIQYYLNGAIAVPR
ncbi:MAG: bifunctional diaminohydroxyphosphoribosylaminopyrimidine deaminase/5-amino-6-(5-phosphoribosylamino)uracil reductase RibD [Flavitalea sp.]